MYIHISMVKIASFFSSYPPVTISSLVAGIKQHVQPARGLLLFATVGCVGSITWPRWMIDYCSLPRQGDDRGMIQ